MPFSADWPPGCPPDDAEDAQGEVFRIVKTDPPTAADFLSYHEMGITRGDPVRRCGRSVFRVRADAEHASRAFPNLGNIIARAMLLPEHGKTK